jgi:ABC-type phosphate transport system substrate-binding protein
MRMLSKVLAGSVAAAAMVALTAGPALADPPAGVTPRPQDAVGTGSDSIQYLMDQLGYNFDKANPSAANKLYSWDAVNPDTLAIGDNIVTKKGCAVIARPDGSSAGIDTLAANTKDPSDTKYYCVDYARSSRARESTDPPYSTGGVAFVALAGDAVTWASRDAASGGTDAPATLTRAQLASIYECKTTNWDKVGGKDAPIEVFIPQTSSGTRTFFLTALGGGVTPITPGACANDLPTSSDPDGTLEENEGINPALNSPEAIYFFSVGSFLSQMYHSPACINSGCTPAKSGPPCVAKTGQNMFGCDETGVLQLNELDGTKTADQPTTPWPLTSSTTSAIINSKFQILFQRTLYDVVRYDPNTADHIPGPEAGAPGNINLEQFFGASGYACSSGQAATIKDYGFLPVWPLSKCGTTD